MAQSVSGDNGGTRGDGGGQLVRELEALSQALYKAGHAGGPHSRVVLPNAISSSSPQLEWVEHNFGFSHKPEDPQTEKKKSVWTWKSFRAIAHIGQQKFCCLFTVHVHGIEQLPSSMNGLRLTTQFGQREDATVQTAPAKVLQGAAEFEETLSVKSTVYGSKSGTQGMKYQAKQFTLSLIAPDEGLVLGKNKLDLTRLLPKSLDEDEDKQVTWTTSFKLVGEGQGGTLVVTFGCNILGNDASLLSSSSSRFGESPVLRAVGSFNSSPGGVHAADADFTSPATSESGAEYPGMEHLSLDDPSSMSPSRLENSALRGPMRSDVKASPVRSFSQSDPMLGPSTPGQSEADYSEFGKVSDFENEEEDEPGFTIVDQGVEVGSLLDPVSARTYVDAGADKIEHVDGSYSVALEAQAELGAHAKKGEHADAGNQAYQNTQIYGEDFEVKILAQELENEEEARLMDDELEMQELLAALDVQEYFYDEQDYKPNNRSKTAKADDKFNPVTGEFLDLLESEGEPGSVALASDSEPDSPRAVLLKQFEQEAMLEGGLGWGSEEDVELTSIVEAAESELQKATQTMQSKNRAKLLEDAETEALMEEWGLSKSIFEEEPPRSSWLCDYEKPYDLAVADAPFLGEGMGPVVETRDGGSLRSMSPSNFQASSGSGQLVMQVSKPVVIPADMGSASMDILRRMAAAGMVGMADQAKLAMPLEDITGKTVEQIASEGFAALKGGYEGHINSRSRHLSSLPNWIAHKSSQELSGASSASGYLAERTKSRMAATARGSSGKCNSSKAGSLSEDAFVSLKDLAPMAMQNIEALALEGLKVQSDMAEHEAPFSVDPLSWQEMMALEGGGNSAIGLLEEGSKEASGNSDDALMSMAISLDEWMRLDAGVYDETEMSQSSMVLLASHHNIQKDVLAVGNQKGRRDKADASDLTGGFMGDTLTLAMLVQLRDPLHNNEPVGAPMMALVQAERVMLPPKARIGRSISMKGNTEDDDEPDATSPQPQFKIIEVTMSGLKTSEEAFDKKKLLGWGNQKQQQSGSRWLLANGMAKNTKQHPVLQSKPASVATSTKTGSTSKGGKGDSLWSISSKQQGAGSKWSTAASSKTRNPDISFGKSFFSKRK
ncbi:unnamed protein product [Sphagnum troendelagicum]|uniref:C2 NT-type domain-containing protein n=1 Tax=Sphagnum troendelagicum TaxID=128251 RepID=A0ABP0TMC2_9BRYO